MREKLLLFVLLLSTGLSAQYVKINEPVDCERALAFNITASWGALLTDSVWTGDVAIVDDGSALPTEGCNPLVNGAEVTGKIALIDRGSCNFSLKALNAQNAGAIAAIIANHTPGAGTLVMGAGSFATDVTIPVVMINYEDGQLIKEKLAMGNVNMSMGDLRFDNDLSVTAGGAMFPGYSTIPVHQVASAGQTVFTPGAAVGNSGLVDGTNIYVEATINHVSGGNSTEVYNETGSAASVMPDSSEFIILSDFDPSSTGMGRYDFTYSVGGDEEDDVPFDNTLSASFHVTNNVYAKGAWDEANNRPARTNAYTIAGGGAIEMLTPYEFPNGTDLRVDSVIFYVSTSAASLGGIPITIYLYNWVDADGDGNFADGEAEIGAFGFYEFDINTTSTGEWVTLGIEDFFTGEPGYVVPNDGARLVVGTRYEGVDLVFFGFDENTELDAYINQYHGPNGTYNDAQLPYAQTTSFGPAGADFGSIGIFTDTWFCSSTALYVNSTVVSNKDLTDAEASINVFPNPASDYITVNVELNKLDNNRLSYQIVDMQGRTIHWSEKTRVSTDSQRFDVANLSAGSYQLIVKADEGSKTLNFVVK